MVSSAGTVTSPPTGVVWTIDPWTGIISESGTTAFANPDFHGKLASNKQLVVGTATNQNGMTTPSPIQFRVMQKLVSSPTYTTSDIAGKSFTMHQIESGAGSDWVHADGSVDLASNFTLSVMTRPSGTTPGGPTAGRFLLDPATGLVTLSSNTYFQGILSPDKSYIVATETDPSISNLYRLTVVQIAKIGQPFTTSNVAGSWHFHGLIGGIPAWIYQTVSINTLGHVTITSELTSMGTPTTLPTGATAQVDSAGNFTSSDDPTLHATLSSGKDMLVSTQTITTNSGSINMFGVIVK